MIQPAIFHLKHTTHVGIDDDIGGDGFENHDDAVNADDDYDDDMECVLSVDTLYLRILYP